MGFIVLLVGILILQQVTPPGDIHNHGLCGKHNSAARERQVPPPQQPQA